MDVHHDLQDPHAARSRRKLLVLCAASIVLAAAVFPLDHGLSAWAVAWEPPHGAGDTLFRAVKAFGKGDVLALVLLAACLTRLRKPAVHGLVSLLLVALPVHAIKLLVGRERPAHAGESFPSGDTASVVAAFAPLAIASPELRAPIAVLALCVGAFRVIASYHYPSDVLAGAAVGFAAAWGALRIVPSRWLRPRPRLVLPLILLAVVIVVVIAIQSANNSPSQIFLYLLLPWLVIAVLCERRRLARYFSRPERLSAPGLARVRR